MVKCRHCRTPIIEGEFCSERCLVKQQEIRDNVLLWFEATSTSIIREKLNPRDIDWRQLEENAPHEKSAIHRLRDLYNA